MGVTTCVTLPKSILDKTLAIVNFPVCFVTTIVSTVSHRVYEGCTSHIVYFRNEVAQQASPVIVFSNVHSSPVAKTIAPTLFSHVRPMSESDLKIARPVACQRSSKQKRPGLNTRVKVANCTSQYQTHFYSLCGHRRVLYLPDSKSRVLPVARAWPRESPAMGTKCSAEIPQATQLSNALKSVGMPSSLVGVVTSGPRLAVPSWNTRSRASSFRSSSLQGAWIRF